MARRLEPVDHAAARELHNAFAFKVAGMSPGAVASAAYAEATRRRPSPPPPGAEVVQAAMRELSRSGAVPPGFSIIRCSQEHFILGQGKIASAYDRISMVLAAKFGHKISGEVVYRLSREACGENVRAQDRPVTTLFGSAVPPAPGRLPRDRALSGELL